MLLSQVVPEIWPEEGLKFRKHVFEKRGFKVGKLIFTEGTCINIRLLLQVSLTVILLLPDGDHELYRNNDRFVSDSIHVLDGAACVSCIKRDAYEIRAKV